MCQFRDGFRGRVAHYITASTPSRGQRCLNRKPLHKQRAHCCRYCVRLSLTPNAFLLIVASRYVTVISKQVISSSPELLLASHTIYSRRMRFQRREMHPHGDDHPEPQVPRLRFFDGYQSHRAVCHLSTIPVNFETNYILFSVSHRHAFNVETSFRYSFDLCYGRVLLANRTLHSYYGGCDGQGATCKL